MQMYLKYKIPFFKQFQAEVLQMICDRLESRSFKSQEIGKIILMIKQDPMLVMSVGDEGDCMYILVQGEVGVYIDEECQNCIAVLRENKVFGERALETDDRRYGNLFKQSYLQRSVNNGS